MAEKQAIKIILVGDSSVGKTSLITSMLDRPFIARTDSTLGCDRQRTNFSHQGRDFVVELWDTAGQERFQSLTAQFFRKTHAVGIVFSANQRSSFEHIEQWLDVSKQLVTPYVRFVLLGNKTDVAEREVNTATAEQLSRALGFERYFEVSARTGANVKDALETLELLAIQCAEEQWKQNTSDSDSLHEEVVAVTTSLKQAKDDSSTTGSKTSSGCCS
eukprot:m.87998 g.87998  ORF g.87998 m.87998 type:complete len:217 (-) comp12846_c1_seq3:392-1042(-)